MNKNALALFQATLQEAGLRYGKAETLVRAGWTLPMVREAADIAQVSGVRFGYIARMERLGIPIKVVGELIEFKQDYPDLSMPLLWQCWQMCVEQRLVTDDDRAFFISFLEAAESLFQEAAVHMRTGVTRSPSFVFRRLLHYAKTQAHGDLEMVMQEIFDDPEGMIERIMDVGEHGTSPGRVHRGNPYDNNLDLTDLADE